MCATDIGDLLVIVSAPSAALTPIEQYASNVLTDYPPEQAHVAPALGAGLRASEVTGAKFGNMISDDDSADWLRAVQCKGRRDRRIPLLPDAVQVLRESVAARKAKRDNYSFTLRQGEFGRRTAARYDRSSRAWLRRRGSMNDYSRTISGIATRTDT